LFVSREEQNFCRIKKGEEPMQIKINEPVKNDQGTVKNSQTGASARYSQLISALPRETVDPAARDKNIVGSCNR
jgi:hypothetical protein